MSTSVEYVDVLFHNARVYTVDSNMPWATAVAVQAGQIAYVGDERGAEQFVGPKTRSIDLDRRLMLPGFVESHWHLSSTTFSRQLVLHEVSPTAIAETVRAYCDAHLHESAITGVGWIEPLMPAGLVCKETLDAVCPDRPVVLLSSDFHTLWVNSRALEIAGIDADTPSVVGEGTSWFEKDPQTQEPTGKIVDAAAQNVLWNRLTEKGFLPAGIDVYTEAIGEWQHRLAAAGVTTLFDAGFFEPSGNQALLYEALGALERDQRLLMRVVGSYYHYQGMDSDPVEIISRFKRQYNSELVRAQVLKIFLDGTEIAHTAYLLEPYADRPDTCGHVVIAKDEYERVVLAADARGIDVMVHCIGDAAVRLALDVFEKAIEVNRSWDRRHCITHAFLTNPQDIPRFRQLGVIANTQLQWGVVDPYTKVIREYYGEARWRQMYKFRTFVDEGVVVSLGMDALACQCHMQHRPMEHIESGHTRQAPGKPDSVVFPETHERMRLPDLIAGYTINGAYQLRLEKEVGSIEVGKRADLIVLDKDLFDTEPHNIGSIDVVLTMMNGRVTYDAGVVRSLQVANAAG